jgi:hypothetical protein
MSVDLIQVEKPDDKHPNGLPVYKLPLDQAVWLLARVALDGLWAKDVPLHFLVLAPRGEWGTTPTSYSLFVASVLDYKGFAWKYRCQIMAREWHVRPWLHARREAGYLDVARESLPIGTFPRDVVADIVRLELPAVAGDRSTGSGPFDGRLHLFLEAGYRAAGWHASANEPEVPKDLSTGSVRTLPAQIYCPVSPVWGTLQFPPKSSSFSSRGSAPQAQE